MSGYSRIARIMILTALVLGVSCSTHSGKNNPLAAGGILDLRDWDFEKNGPASLAGEWEFYWDRMIEPGAFHAGEKPVPTGFMRLPGSWLGYTTAGKKLPGLGYASFRLTVRMNKSGRRMLLSPTPIYCASTIYADGIGVLTQDIPGQGAERSSLLVKTAEFKPASNDLELVMQVSNYSHARGGPVQVFSLGYADQVRDADRTRTIFNSILCGSIFIMALYHLFLYFIMRTDRSPFYFSLCCFDMTVFILFMYQIVPLDLNASQIFRTFYFSLFLLPVLFMLYLFHLFRDEFHILALRAIQITSIISCSLTLLMPPYLFIRLLTGIHAIMLLSYLYALYALTLAWRRKRQGAGIIIGGGLVLVLFLVNDILHAQQVINTGNFAPVGILIFIFFQAMLLSLRFANAFRAVEKLTGELSELNRTLESKVEHRTMELKAAYEEMHAMNEHLVSARDALWGEMQVAKKIQTILLPKEPTIKKYDIAVYMKPSASVGGDYYDIINIEGMDWVIIGDVSGHGIPAGLVMMMVQTAIHSTLEQNPGVGPSELLARINRTISRNMSQFDDDRYMTITVLAMVTEGTFTFSGLHQDIYIYRHATTALEVIHTDGAWIGIMPEISSMLKDSSLRMEPGDVMLLYTDGITEAWEKGSVAEHRDPDRDMFGSERLMKVFTEAGETEPEEIKNRILKALAGYDFNDDITILILKRIQ